MGKLSIACKDEAALFDRVRVGSILPPLDNPCRPMRPILSLMTGEDDPYPLIKGAMVSPVSIHPLSPDERHDLAAALVSPKTPCANAFTIEMVRPRLPSAERLAALSVAIGGTALTDEPIEMLKYMSTDDLKHAFDGLVGEGAVFIDRITSSVGLPSTSFVSRKRVHQCLESEAGKYVGLHVDTFENRTFAERPLSRRRIGINIGPGRRSVYVVVPDVVTMAEALDLDPQLPLNTSNVLWPYIHKQHSERNDVKVLAFRQEPGEAYILPTECVGHDARPGIEPSTMLFWQTTMQVGELETVFSRNYAAVPADRRCLA